jgi:hypothetical protein
VTTALFFNTGAITVTYSTYTGNYKAPYYLRLIKHADSVYTGYISPDGGNWEKIGEVVIQLKDPTKFFVGMAVTSNDASLLSRAVFDGWTIEDSLGNNVNANFSLNVENANISDGIVTEQNLKVYPNPTTKNFWIDFDISQKQNAVLSIIGMGTAVFFSKRI